MKSRLVVLIVLLFCGTSSYVSADEFLSGGCKNSTFENPFKDIRMENNTRLWSADASSNMSRLSITSTQPLSFGGLDDAANMTTSYLSGFSMTDPTLELTPMIGYTFGGRFDYEEEDGSDETIEISDASSIGFRLGYNLSDNSQIEFLYSQQETEITGGELFPRDALFDLDVRYFHIGGSLLWNRGNGLEPYFTGTIGLTNFDPDDSGVDSLTRFSMGFGGGVRVMPLQRLGLYTGVRGLVTFVNSEMEGYSGSKGTYIRIEADTVWQFQVYTGLILAF
jgi:hypothetical protein